MGTVIGSPRVHSLPVPTGWVSCTSSGSRQVAVWSPHPALWPMWQEVGPGSPSMFALGLEADGDRESFLPNPPPAPHPEPCPGLCPSPGTLQVQDVE